MGGIARGRARLEELWNETRDPRVNALARAGIGAEELTQTRATLAAVLAVLEP